MQENSYFSFIQFSQLYESCSQEEQKLIDANKSILTFKNGQTVYNENTQSLGLYVLNSGLVKMLLRVDGKYVLSELKRSGEMFGYQAVITGTQHNTAVVAIEQTELFVIPVAVFEKILGNKDVLILMMKVLGHDVAVFQHRLADITYNSATKRLAKAILYLDEIYKNQDSGFIQLKRNDLAQYVGVTREALIRLVGDFRSLGYINIEKGKIKLANKSKVQQLSDL